MRPTTTSRTPFSDTTVTRSPPAWTTSHRRGVHTRAAGRTSGAATGRDRRPPQRDELPVQVELRVGDGAAGAAGSIPESAAVAVRSISP